MGGIGKHDVKNTKDKSHIIFGSGLAGSYDESILLYIDFHVVGIAYIPTISA